MKTDGKEAFYGLLRMHLFLHLILIFWSTKGDFNIYSTDAPTILSDWKEISMKIAKIKGRDANLRILAVECFFVVIIHNVLSFSSITFETS